MFTASGFNMAVKQYTINQSLQPLTIDTFDYFMKLYVDIHKTIKDYSSFTFAMSQGRVPMLSTPEASRSRYTPSDLPEPDEGEMSRLWRGFLLYELICRMDGVSCTMASSFGDFPQPVGLFDPTKLFPCLPLYMREEANCVWAYFNSQYNLAFNCLLEKFELAVSELGQSSPGSSPNQIGDTRSIIEQLSVGSQRNEVHHLTHPSRHGGFYWASSMALLGASFCQQYLSWNSSCRLDFVRATYHPLCCAGGFHCYIMTGLGRHLDITGLSSKGFGWPCQPEYELDMYDDLTFTPCEDRMRSVGWIFWKNPDRLCYMNLGISQEYEMSSEHYEVDLGLVRHDLKLEGRLHLLEASVQRQDWEILVQRFRIPNSRFLHDDVKDLFMATGNLSTRSGADIASILGRQDAGGVLSQAKADDS